MKSLFSVGNLLLFIESDAQIKTVQISSAKLAAGVVFVATLIALLPVLEAGFVIWDDPAYVYQNRMIMGLSWAHMKEIFSTFVMGNYHPIPILTYALEYSLVGLEPFLYHLDNLLLHLINTLLVFCFIFQLSGKKVKTAALTAALFGIHPMHVESVAWVSERKDVLYVLFLLLSMIAYLNYVQRHYKPKYYFYTLVFFLLALLSKGQAVVLAPIMVLIDYFVQRKLDKKAVFEKAPFFLLAFFFGVLAIIAQHHGAALSRVKIEHYKTLFTGSYGFLTYLFKAVIPVNLSALHPYPIGKNGELPVLVYLSPILIFSLFLFFYKAIKNSRPIVFGLLFFVFAITPVLQFLPIGDSIVAERYSYFSYIGLFFVFGYLYTTVDFSNKLGKYNSTARAVTLVYLAFLFTGCYSRAKVWKGTTELWADVIEKYPNSLVAYTNRAYHYFHMKEYDLALQDYTKGISVHPDELILFESRARVYEAKKMWDLAIADYTKCILLRKDDPRHYISRGQILSEAKRNFPAAIEDFNVVLKLAPHNFGALMGKGMAYLRNYESEKAIETFNKALQINPKAYNIYVLRAEAYGQSKSFQKALEDAQYAAKNGVEVDPYLIKSFEEKQASVGAMDPHS